MGAHHRLDVHPLPGPDTLNVKCWGRYGPERLEPTPGTATEWLDAGCDVYAYFNNDWHGQAVKDAIDLREALTG